jgi:uncharacterized delta-60 repeat protein
MVNTLSHDVLPGYSVRASALVVVAIQLLSVASARAAPGDLDLTFGDAGRVFIDLGDQPSYAFRLIEQIDGKLVLASTIYDTNSAQRFLARLEPDGTLDSGFGSGGIAVSSTLHETTADMIQQADGKLVVAGDAWVQGKGYDAALWRLNLDGSTDATFGTDGKASLDAGGLEIASRLLQQDDGKLVIAGTSEGSDGHQHLMLGRFNPDGSLDATFGSDGSVILDFPSAWLATTALLRQPDGKLVVAGHQRGKVTVARFTGDGVLDDSFDVDGTLEIAATTIDSAHSFTSGGSATLQDDGRIVVVGKVGHSTCCDPWGDPTFYRDGFILRLQSDGAIDPTFGGTGIVTAPPDFASVAAQSDGKIVAAFSDSYSMGLQRFNVDGGVDGSFGDGGQSIFKLGWPDTPHLYFADAMIRQADGKFLLVGGYAVAAGPGWNAAIGRFVADDSGPAPPANLSFTSNAAISVREDAGSITLAVSRSGLSVGAVNVDYATSSDTAQSGADFVAAQGERLWASGDSSLKTISVNITNDTTVESDETFMVVLSNPSAGAILGSNSTVTVTIVDDDRSDPPTDDPPAVGSNGGGGGAFDWLAVLVLSLLGWLTTPRRVYPCASKM